MLGKPDTHPYFHLWPKKVVQICRTSHVHNPQFSCGQYGKYANCQRCQHYHAPKQPGQPFHLTTWYYIIPLSLFLTACSLLLKVAAAEARPKLRFSVSDQTHNRKMFQKRTQDSTVANSPCTWCTQGTYSGGKKKKKRDSFHDRDITHSLSHWTPPVFKKPAGWKPRTLGAFESQNRILARADDCWGTQEQIAEQLFPPSPVF